MKKNGFTLVELLAVIVILGVIGMIVFPAVQTTIKKNKEKLYVQQINSLVDAASKYVVDHDADHLDRFITYTGGTITGSNTCKLAIGTNSSVLVTGGYLKNSGNMKDPITGNNLNGYILIKWSMDTNQYEIKYYNKDSAHRDGSNNKTYLNNMANLYKNDWSTSYNNTSVESIQYCNY